MAGPAARVWRSDGKSGVGDVLTLVSELTSQCGKVPFSNQIFVVRQSWTDQIVLAATSRASWLPLGIHGGGGVWKWPDYYKDDEENPLKTTRVTIQ